MGTSSASLRSYLAFIRDFPAFPHYFLLIWQFSPSSIAIASEKGGDSSHARKTIQIDPLRGQPIAQGIDLVS
jgi:hypothetical protein